MFGKLIYLDNGATTKVDDKVLKAMLPFFTEKYGNASSSHILGREAKEAMEKSRKVIAKTLGAKTDEIIFTSGGTESNNLAIKGVAFANKKKGNHIIITTIEHDCIVNCCKWLETQGFNITYLDVDKDGFVNPKEFEKAITKKTILASVIHGNNEIGTVQDLKTLGNICKKHRIIFHTDACQSFTKTDINVKKLDIDLITLNAHKIHGPKGVGALYIKKGTKIIPWQHGGGHENNFRSGTENVSGIVGFAKSAELGMNLKHVKHMAKLRDKLINAILEMPGASLNGPRENRLCNNVNIKFKDLEGEVVGGYLNQNNICSSVGSACLAHSTGPSHVLKAIGLSDAEAASSLRLTLSRFTTEKEIEYTIKVLNKIVKKLS